MTEIKLDTWTWGVVPKLHDFAVVVTGGDIKQTPTRPWLPFWYCSLHPKQSERWYAVLSIGQPEMPEEELRLPEGWSVTADGLHGVRGVFMLEIQGPSLHGQPESLFSEQHRIVRPTRAECVREINRLLEGK